MFVHVALQLINYFTPRVYTLTDRNEHKDVYVVFRIGMDLPSAKHVVITAGSPSGMAATARATAILK